MMHQIREAYEEQQISASYSAVSHIFHVFYAAVIDRSCCLLTVNCLSFIFRKQFETITSLILEHILHLGS